MNLVAYVDHAGTDEVVNGFRARARGQGGDDAELLNAAHARGFSVRFPQITTGPGFYLPFSANLVLEVLDWRGKTTRFGSLPCLERELTEVMALVGTADPAAAAVGQNDMQHEDRLARAYNAARIKLDLARAGLKENLPLWFSE